MFDTLLKHKDHHLFVHHVPAERDGFPAYVQLECEQCHDVVLCYTDFQKGEMVRCVNDTWSPGEVKQDHIYQIEKVVDDYIFLRGLVCSHPARNFVRADTKFR